MNRSLILSFLLASLSGAAVWALSPLITGHAEPWDADGIYYIAALVLAGLLSGLIAPKPLWVLYLGSIFGQLLYQFLFFTMGPLIAVGVVFLLVFSLVFLGGAFIGSRVRNIFGSRTAAA